MPGSIIEAYFCGQYIESEKLKMIFSVQELSCGGKSMLSPTARNMGASLSPQPDVSGELNTEALTCIVERLESEIIDGSWIHISYEETDLEMMPFLVTGQ